MTRALLGFSYLTGIMLALGRYGNSLHTPRDKKILWLCVDLISKSLKEYAPASEWYVSNWRIIRGSALTRGAWAAGTS